MRKILLVMLIALTVTRGNAQTKSILLEEFSGAHCGQCPMGNYMLDSMINKYPSVIGVSLHAYSSPDAMFFAQVDTIGTAYAPGAPLGAIDRIYNSTFGYVAIYHNAWDAAIQNRLLQPVQLSVGLVSTWNSITRNISATITTTLISNLPSGDYRFNLYIVEDSVTGSGPGYDQVNLYDTQAGNPFYGMGNPIIGYFHRHVVRAILPSAWGIAGIIPSSPLSGQAFSYPVNYTLPANINENRVSLVAFVSKYTSAHTGDEALNAVQSKLIGGITGISETQIPETNVTIYPNPAHDKINIHFNHKVSNFSVEIINAFGQIVLSVTNQKEIDVSNFTEGLYIIKVRDELNQITKKLLRQ
jgi:type IX secretion system substrate protein/outer membrane protein Omp28